LKETVETSPCRR